MVEERLRTLPKRPGVYLFKGDDGEILYVGKAKSLRSRLSNYFQNPRNLATRTRQMVEAAESVEWIQVANEVEALMVRPDTTARMVAKATAQMKAKKISPPSRSASNGALMLPLEMLSGPMMVAAPNPKKVVIR